MERTFDLITVDEEGLVRGVRNLKDRRRHLGNLRLGVELPDQVDFDCRGLNRREADRR